MTVEQRADGALVEQVAPAGRGPAGPARVLAQLARQPVADRDREALLGPVERLVGDPAAQRLAEDPLLLAPAHLQLRRDGRRQRHEVGVQQRRPGLEAVRHGGDVDLGDEVVGQMRAAVDVEHAADDVGRPRLVPAIDDDALGRTGARQLAVQVGRIQRPALGGVHALDVVRVAGGRVEVDRAAQPLGSSLHAGPAPGRRKPAQRGAHRASQRRGHPVEPGRQRVGRKPRVPTEALVAAVAGERDGDLAARQLAEVEGRDRGRVGKRLAVMADDAGDDLDRLRADDELGVLGAEVLGDAPGVGHLVEAIVVEADGERAHRRAAVLGHGRDDGGRVDAARQEGADGDVGHHAPPRRGPQLVPDALRQLALVADVQRGPEVELPPAVDRHPPVAHDHPVAGRQLAHAGERAQRRGHVAEREVAVDRDRVDRARTSSSSSSAQLRGEGQRAGPMGVDQRLLADAVAGDQQQLAPAVPQREGEHAAQVVHAVDAVVLVEVGDRLGVACGGQAVPGLAQPPAQVLVAVDLAVEDDDDRAVLVGHRLVAGLRVDDGQALDAQPDVAVDEAPTLIGPAMLLRDRQAIDELWLDRAVVPTQLSGDSAHSAINVPTAAGLARARCPHRAPARLARACTSPRRPDPLCGEHGTWRDRRLPPAPSARRRRSARPDRGSRSW
ncbi:MAG: hypothetical protein R2736_07030 [Solirubrobacterales bacterium]